MLPSEGEPAFFSADIFVTWLRGPRYYMYIPPFTLNT